MSDVGRCGQYAAFKKQGCSKWVRSPIDTIGGCDMANHTSFNGKTWQYCLSYNERLRKSSFLRFIRFFADVTTPAIHSHVLRVDR